MTAIEVPFALTITPALRFEEHYNPTARIKSKVVEVTFRMITDDVIDIYINIDEVKSDANRHYVTAGSVVLDKPLIEKLVKFINT